MSHSELGHFELDPACGKLLDEDFCRDRMAAPLGRLPENDVDPIHLGMLDMHDVDLVREVASRIGRSVIPVQLNAWEIRRALDVLHGRETPSDEEQIKVKLEAGRRISFDPGQATSKLLDDLLSEAVQRGASDVHIEVYQRDVDLRFRIDGILRQINTPLNVENVGRIIARLKVLAELDLVERRRPQDGRLILTYSDAGRERRLQLRLAVIPGIFGEEIVLRILDPAAVIIDLEKIGMSDAMRATYESMILRPQGLTLVAGPTCSGKTTTLYGTLARINTPENKILTAEDPVEYEFPKVCQKEITAEMGFADYIRAFLRQNPDVMLIGEVRDPDTAVTAVRAANTGHRVLTTIHTADAVSAISRLRALGVADDFLSDVLIGVLSQRLLRRVCETCRRPEGCDACNGSGYRGRVGIFELFEATDEIRGLIAQGRSVHEIKQAARRAGARPLIDDAREKVAAGITTEDEVARVVGR